MSGTGATRIIRDGCVVDDPWRTVGAEEAFPGGAIIVPLERCEEALDSGHPAESLGVMLPGSADASVLDSLPARLPLIAIHIESPGDGRGYSLARTLRERGFAAELRACGAFGRDQLFYLARCGFTAFAPEGIEDLGALLAGLDDFSRVYQPAADAREPIAALRAARGRSPAR